MPNFNADEVAGQSALGHTALGCYAVFLSLWEYDMVRELITRLGGTVAVTSVVVAIGIVAAKARDDGQWADVPENVRQWFESLKQPDHPRQSCCGEADAFEADSFEVEGDHYVAIITGHRAVSTIPLGTRIPVPNHKMKHDAANPTCHGTLFIRPR